MDGDADAARELERLRAELTEFVVDALSERMANGDQPELSAALVEAIDRRVDQAVAARLSDAEFPDPERFADAVLAAAAGRAGSVDPASLRASRRPERTGGRAAPARGIGMVPLILLLAAAIALTAAATYFVLRGWSSDTTTNVAAPMSPDPVVYDANGMQIAPGNPVAPGSAGGAENVSQNVQAPNP